MLAHRTGSVAWLAVHLADFDYHLPEARIAQSALEPRDSARLLVDQGDAAVPADRHVRDLTELLGDGDLLVVNDSRVIPARLAVHRQSGGAAEVLLLEPVASDDGERRVWEALVRPARKLKVGEQLYGRSGTPIVEVGARTLAGDTFQVTLLGDGDPLAMLEREGDMPLPPYITTPLQQRSRYQTVYANEPGSAAAPTAGLHFTPELLARLEGQGVG
ncbi:MAG TPA: S-adenosylmethionine:tRNA ribosyltransferase-isomerase, partial [Ilumatobacteraceae bacterium]|nr:S-adenosylmethionine:tRNA ribosyltransferase-isomerase [Ilumatobacteraceae bacterium]